MEACFVGARLDPPDRLATRRIVGLSLVEAMRALLPDAEHGLHLNLAEEYKLAFQRLRANGLVEEPLFEGVPDMLTALADSGWLLGVATGKSDRGLSLCLEHHGLAKAFVTLQTADRHPSKPHPSMVEAAIAEAGAAPATTAVIGDTSFDMAMARAAGAHAIGVAWGYHDSHELEAAGAHHVAASPGHVPLHLETLT